MLGNLNNVVSLQYCQVFFIQQQIPAKNMFRMQTILPRSLYCLHSQLSCVRELVAPLFEQLPEFGVQRARIK